MNARWLGLLGVVLLAPAARGEERTLAIQDVTAVQDGHGSTRVFFRTATVPFSASSLLKRAVLTVPFTGAAQDARLELGLCPVTQAWRAPSFETPFDASLAGRCTVDLRRGSGVATFDLTVPLKESLEEGVFSDGFVLLARSSEAVDLSRFASLAGAVLRVSTMTLPSGWPPHSRERAHLARHQGGAVAPADAQPVRLGVGATR